MNVRTTLLRVFAVLYRPADSVMLLSDPAMEVRFFFCFFNDSLPEPPFGKLDPLGSFDVGEN